MWSLRGVLHDPTLPTVGRVFTDALRDLYEEEKNYNNNNKISSMRDIAVLF